jgi:hypothetical protein
MGLTSMTSAVRTWRGRSMSYMACVWEDALERVWAECTVRVMV